MCLLNPFNLRSSVPKVPLILTASTAALAFYMGSSMMYSGVRTTSTKIIEKNSELTVKTASVKASESQALTALDNSIPDSYILKVNEWDCSTGSLKQPVRTLGNPALAYVLPRASPRPLTDVRGEVVAQLSPDGSISYSALSLNNCPQIDPPLSPLFSSPQVGSPSQVPQLSTIKISTP